MSALIAVLFLSTSTPRLPDCEPAEFTRTVLPARRRSRREAQPW